MRRLTIGIIVGSFALGTVGCAGASASSSGPRGSTALAPHPTSGQAVAPQVAASSETAERTSDSWLLAETTSDYLLASQREQTFGVWVEVPPDLGIGHVPTAMTLAIDTSGSMQGEKIVHARAAAQRIVDGLADGDILGIVTFSDRARVLVPPAPLSPEHRRRIRLLVEELSANGGTALHDGLRAAETQLWGSPDTHLVRRLVMISDGQATVGPTSPAELGRVVEVGVQRGIQVTSIGVGVDYDEHTLNELAIRTSGRLHHVEHSEQLPGIVADELALLDATGAALAHLELVAAPGVQLVGTDIAHSQWTDASLIVPLGTMFEGQRRELLVRARLDGEATEGPKVLASVRLHFRDPAEDGLARVRETVVRATMTHEPSLVAASENSRMQTLLAVREASLLTQQASRQLNDGDFDRADLVLAQAEERLQRQADKARTTKEKQQVLKSAAKIKASRRGIVEAKAAPAATRAAAGRALSLEANDDAMDAIGY